MILVFASIILTHAGLLGLYIYVLVWLHLELDFQFIFSIFPHPCLNNEKSPNIITQTRIIRSNVFAFQSCICVGLLLLLELSKMSSGVILHPADMMGYSYTTYTSPNMWNQRHFTVELVTASLLLSGTRVNLLEICA